MIGTVTFSFEVRVIRLICYQGTNDKEPSCPMQETQEMQVLSLGQEDPLEEHMATHSSILAWRIPWTKESGGLQFIGSQRVRHD